MNHAPHDLSTLEKVLAFLTSLENVDRAEVLKQIQDIAFPAWYALSVSPLEHEAFLKACAKLAGSSEKTMRQTWQSFISARGDTAEEGEKLKEADRLIALALEHGVALFIGHDGEIYADVQVNQHRETHRVGNRGFAEWLEALSYKTWRRSVSRQALTDAKSTLEAMARHGEQRVEHRVWSRVARLENRLYLDLGRPEWDAVEIDENGWRVVAAPPVRFIRNRNMGALPIPEQGGDLHELFELLNIEALERPLVAAFLVQALNPRKPYPLLALHGEQGSSKSTTAKLLKRLIDPGAGELLAEPKDLEGFMTAARNRHIVVFDNLSNLPVWLSDGLCRLSTGGGFSKRALYSNDEEIVIDVERPVILTGIAQLSTRPDLLERTMMVELPVIPRDKRMDEATVYERYEQMRPRVLGALLTGLSTALKNLDTVRQNLKERPRMADFAIWATAAETALGFEAGAFLEAFTGNQRLNQSLVMQTEPVLREVVQLIKKEGRWQGTASELLTKLELGISEEAKRSRAWATNAKALSEKLTRNAGVLRSYGLELVSSRTKSERILCLEFRPDAASPSSPASQPSPVRVFLGDESKIGASWAASPSPEQPATGDADDAWVTQTQNLRHLEQVVHHGVNQSGDAGDAQSLSLCKEKEREEEETRCADHSSRPPQPSAASSLRVLEEARSILARLSDVEAGQVLNWVRAMESGLADKKHQAETKLRAFLEQWRSSGEGQGGVIYA
jgi:ABC-type oligopeptide transport system ATPase subunit